MISPDAGFKNGTNTSSTSEGLCLGTFSHYCHSDTISVKVASVMHTIILTKTCHLIRLTMFHPIFRQLAASPVNYFRGQRGGHPRDLKEDEAFVGGTSLARPVFTWIGCLKESIWTILFPLDSCARQNKWLTS